MTWHSSRVGARTYCCWQCGWSCPVASPPHTEAPALGVHRGSQARVSAGLGVCLAQAALTSRAVSTTLCGPARGGRKWSQPGPHGQAGGSIHWWKGERGLSLPAFFHLVILFWFEKYVFLSFSFYLPVFSSSFNIEFLTSSLSSPTLIL